MISKVLAKTVAMIQDYGVLYKMVEQTVLFYGSDILVVTGLMLKVLEGFHHRASRRIVGLTDRRVEDI